MEFSSDMHVLIIQGQKENHALDVHAFVPTHVFHFHSINNFESNEASRC